MGGKMNLPGLGMGPGLCHGPVRPSLRPPWQRPSLPRRPRPHASPHGRPGILKGTFKFAMPPAKTQQFICCRDMGYAAAMSFQSPSQFQGNDIELAGDQLTCPQVAEAFSASQEA
jgi:hypothetical protein